MTAPADDDSLLQAAQQPNSPARNQLHPIFGGYLFRVASRCCEQCGLGPDDAREVVAMVETKVLDQDPETKPRPFDRGRCTARQYLTGLVRNATKQLYRFRRQVPAWGSPYDPDTGTVEQHGHGSSRRHDWHDPDNAVKGLPSSPEEIIDPVCYWGQQDEQYHDLVEVALAGEPQLILTLVRACYYNDMTLTEAARLVGFRSHSTVLRQLDAFRLRARARLEEYLLCPA